MLKRLEGELAVPAEVKSAHDAGADMAVLYDRHKDDVLRFCMGQLRNYEDAADIMQEAFCRLLTKPDRNSVKRPRAYLIETAMNLIRDKYRTEQRQKKKAHIDLDLISDTDLVCPAPSAEDRLQSRQAIGKALDALAGLPPKCQAVFVMKLYYGSSYLEIADELDIPSVVGVKKYMMRALGHLRDSLDIDEIRTKSETANGSIANGASVNGSSAKGTLSNGPSTNGVERHFSEAAE